MAKRLMAVLAIGWLLVSGCSAGRSTTSSQAGNDTDAATLPCSQAGGFAAHPGTQAGYQQIAFSVQAPGNSAPPRIHAADIRLYHGSNAIPVAWLEAQPATVGILIDTSAGMSSRLAIVSTALADFLRKLNSRDEVFLVTFSDRPHLVVPLTSRRRAIIDQLELLHASGGIALYDAIIKGLRVVSSGCNARKALLLVTGGMDDASLSDARQVKDETRAGGVSIYSIGIGASNLFRSDCSTAKVACVDSKTLAELAKDTGGEAFVIARTHDARPMASAMSAVAATINNHYIVGFAGSAAPRDIRIRLVHGSGMTVKIERAPQP